MFADWSVAQTVSHWFNIISQLLPTRNCSSVNNADSSFPVLDSCSAVGREQFWLVTDSLSPDGSGAGVSPKPRSMRCHKDRSRGMRITEYHVPPCLEGEEAPWQLHPLEQGFSGCWLYYGKPPWASKPKCVVRWEDSLSSSYKAFLPYLHRPDSWVTAWRAQP